MWKRVMLSVVCLGMMAMQGHAITLEELTQNAKYVKVSDQLETGARYIDSSSLAVKLSVSDKTNISVITYELVPENTVITTDNGQVFGPAIVEDEIILQYDEHNSMANLTKQQMSPRDIVNVKTSDSGISVLFGKKLVFDTNTNTDLQHVFENQRNEYESIGMDSAYYSVALNIYKQALHKDFEDTENK